MKNPEEGGLSSKNDLKILFVCMPEEKKLFNVILVKFKVVLYVSKDFVSDLELSVTDDGPQKNVKKKKKKTPGVHELGTVCVRAPWLGCYSIKGLFPALNLLVPIYTPGCHHESKVSCPRTQCSALARAQTQTGPIQNPAH